MRAGTPRARHLRKRRYGRATRTKNLNDFLAERSGALDATGSSQAFTANATTNKLSITTHGHVDGDGPFTVSSDGTLPGGLVADTLYWVYKTGASDLKLATSRRDAVLGNTVDLSSAGSGTHTLLRATTEEAIFDALKANKAETVAAATDVDTLS